MNNADIIAQKLNIHRTLIQDLCAFKNLKFIKPQQSSLSLNDDKSFKKVLHI